MNIAEQITRAKADYDAVYEAGKKSEYDRLWDALQNNGNRTRYRDFFYSSSFPHLNPKYLIKPDNADSFMCWTTAETVNWEKFDLSATQSLYGAFSYSQKLKVIDTELGVSVTGSALFNSICRYCTMLERVKKITAIPDAVWKDSFQGASNLVEIIFDGEIGKSINFQYSPLNLESAQSVLEHLVNYAGTTDAGTNTVTFSSTTIAYLNEAGAIFNGNTMTWEEYLDSMGWDY